MENNLHVENGENLVIDYVRKEFLKKRQNGLSF